MSSSTTAAIYTRVSTDQQEQYGTSLGTQLDACRRYANDHSYEIVGEHTDTHTGTQYRERSGLSRMRELIRADAVDVVIVYDTSRLSRNMAHFAILEEEIKDHSGRLEFVTEQFEDSAVGRFIRSAKSFADEVENEKRRERSITGRRARLLSGKYLPGFKVRYGYAWADESRSQLEIDPTTAPVVRRIFEEMANGCSLRQIAKGLEDDGIPSPTGRPTWSVPTLHVILKARVYVGEAYGWRRGDDPILLPDGVVPPLVDRVTFEFAQQRLKHNKQHATRNNPVPEASLLRAGFAKCGVCGHTMSVRNTTVRQDGQYFCARHQGKRAVISRRLLDDAVWNCIGHLILSEDPLAGEPHPSTGEGLADPQDELALLDRRLASVQRQRDNVATSLARLTDTDAVDFLVGKLDQLSQQIRAVETERETVQRQAEKHRSRRALLRDFDRWRKETALILHFMMPQRRRTLLEQLGIRVEVFPTGHESGIRWRVVSEIVPSLVYTNSTVVAVLVAGERRADERLAAPALERLARLIAPQRCPVFV